MTFSDQSGFPVVFPMTVVKEKRLRRYHINMFQRESVWSI